MKIRMKDVLREIDRRGNVRFAVDENAKKAIIKKVFEISDDLKGAEIDPIVAYLPKILKSKNLTAAKGWIRQYQMHYKQCEQLLENIFRIIDMSK